jgi:hypothetical protein
VKSEFGQDNKEVGENAKEESFGSSLSRKACGELEGRALNHQGAKPKCTVNNKSETNFRDPKGAAITKSQSVDNQSSTLFLSA